MRKFGIDISRWQGNFDFDRAIAEGVEFAIIKAGGADSGYYKDANFERNYTEAKKRNLPVGCYWFSMATSIIEAENEARYFYQETLQGKQFELPVYMDVEHTQMIGLGKQKLTDIIKAFCDYLEKKGYFVGVYSSLSYFRNSMNDAELQKYTHWVAQYYSTCTYENKDVLGIWQFGGDVNLLRSNQISGVVCDQNYMYVDFPEIIKNGGYNGFKSTSQPVEQKKSNEEIANEVIDGKWGNGAERFTRLSNAGYDYSDIQSIVDKKMQNRGITKGDRVSVSKDGVVYGTNTKFAPFVYHTTMYVREINGNRVIISTEQEGNITGAIDSKYLKKI